MRVGGEARFFCIVKSLEDLKEAVSFCRENKIKFFVLGGGSNIIFSDKGFDGLVIKNEIKNCEILDFDENTKLLKLGAGENWDRAVSFSLYNNLFGLENLSYIPGTVGASAVQNIGAYGVEAKDFIFSVEVYDFDREDIFEFENKNCNFSYRSSIFKKNKKFIITSVTYKLNKKFFPNTKYSGIKEKLQNKTVDNLTAKDIRDIIISLRKEKLPEISELASVGSFFKNPILSKEKFENIQKRFPNIPSFCAEGDMVKIPLGFVLDKICLLKGYKEGEIGTYEKQALVIVNFGGASAKDIFIFSKKIKQKVFEKIGIEIEEEAEFVF